MADGEANSDKAKVEALPTVATKTDGMTRHDGFLPFWTDARSGRIWLEVPAPGAGGVAAEALYVVGLTRGLGSNPVGLDRGQLGGARLIQIRRLGPKVLFEQPNLRYRALNASDAEQRAAEESFATSILWGGEIGALDADGRALVDLTSFVVRDARGVAETLASAEQGTFVLDPARSTVDLSAALAFPDNIELEAVLTWAGEQPGPHVQQTAPTARAVSLIIHHSLIRLPEEGYQPRELDPRIGMFGLEFIDYAAALDAPIRTRWIARHRLEKTDPSAARSTVRDPIVFYVDRGAPEPVRGALLDGARWWAAAFEAAGFIDGYRVELLPEGAHPLDVRYNVIQWVHRSTRGWSYGNAITDPRTGEIIKGHVSLGSLRVRQDRLLFEGLAGAAKTGSGEADDPVQLALARIRQLSAHEVGHTLGITHNFAASTYDDRASVMDYPAPRVGVAADGTFDFSEAYGVGVGSWDTHTVRYAYSTVPPGQDEAAFLTSIVEDGLRDGLLFLSDDDARPASASDARANLWDNGDDAVAELRHVLDVRRRALERFGPRSLRPGQAIAELEEILAPLYFHHRYQLDATAKLVGGLSYHYTVQGDGQKPTEIVSSARQREALASVLAVLEPSALDLSDDLLAMLAPRPFGWQPSIEDFGGQTWPAFDALGAAATAADQVVSLLTVPERLGRLRDFHRRDSQFPSAGEVLDHLIEAALGTGSDSARHQAIRLVVQRAVAERLMARVLEPDVSAAVRAELETALSRLKSRLAARLESSGDDDAAARLQVSTLVSDLDRFHRRDYALQPLSTHPNDPPPGSPIGQDPDPMIHLGNCSHSLPSPAAGTMRARLLRH